jgi:hypothetical protein
MQFVIPINEAKVGESQTLHVLETGSDCARTNKKHLRAYFKKMGVLPAEMKSVFKAMGFVGKVLGK